MTSHHNSNLTTWISGTWYEKNSLSIVPLKIVCTSKQLVSCTLISVFFSSFLAVIMALHGLCLLLAHLSMNIQMKAIEKYFPVVLFIMLYKVVLSFDFVDEILKCDHSNESYWAVLSCGTVYYAVQGGSIFWVCGWNPMLRTFKWNFCAVIFFWPIMRDVDCSLTEKEQFDNIDSLE